MLETLPKKKVGKLLQRCEAKVHLTCPGSTMEGKAAVWPARTELARDKNDKYFMRAFEDGGFITLGRRPRHSPEKI